MNENSELAGVHRKVRFLGALMIMHTVCTALLAIMVLVNALAASR